MRSGKGLSSSRIRSPRLLEKPNLPIPSALKVCGEVGGEGRVRALSLSDVRDSISGASEMDESWAETKLQPAGDGWEVETWSLSSKKSVLPANGLLKKGRFELESDSISRIPY